MNDDLYDETPIQQVNLPRQIFAPQVFPRVFSSIELTPKQIKFFGSIKKYNLSELDVEDSGFRYCGGDNQPNDINYYRMCFPDKPFPYPELQCICGHPIVINCYITNADKTILAVLGRCCIKKFLGGLYRRCERCGENHTSRTMNLCRLCISDHRKHVKDLCREEKAKVREQNRLEKRVAKEKEKETKRLEKELWKFQKNEWKENIAEARNVLKEFRLTYAKRRRWIPLCQVGVVKFDCEVCRLRKSLYPNTICPMCEKGPSWNHMNDVVRLKMMVLLWPIIKGRLLRLSPSENKG
jgi:hypothetical protein